MATNRCSEVCRYCLSWMKVMWNKKWTFLSVIWGRSWSGWTVITSLYIIEYQTAVDANKRCTADELWRRWQGWSDEWASARWERSALVLGEPTGEKTPPVCSRDISWRKDGEAPDPRISYRQVGPSRSSPISCLWECVCVRSGPSESGSIQLEPTPPFPAAHQARICPRRTTTDTRDVQLFTSSHVASQPALL